MSDRNLLFVVLALQNQLVRKSDALVAMNIWITAKHRPIADIIVECGMMRPDDRQLLDVLIDRQIAHHGSIGDSLAALDVSYSIHDLLGRVDDAGVQASVANIGTVGDGEHTARIHAPHSAAGMRYRVLRPHAKGGLGEVFVAEDQELHRQVALKEIREDLAGDSVSRGRFLLEAEVTGRLEHPGIVPVYGLGAYPNGRPFYAMRFIKGDNLREAILRYYRPDAPYPDDGERRLAFRQLLRRFVDVCNAVAYAHSRGVLHRDIKPGNVMLGKFGETLLIDWGLAKAGVRGQGLGDGEGTELGGDESTFRPSSGSGLAETIAGVALGTPAFMSPEQAEGKLSELGPASDIYSLGATLYMLLTSEPPVADGEIGVMLDKVKRGDIATPHQVNRDVPRALDDICRKAMARIPAERYTTATELADDLEHWLADEPVSAHRESVWGRMGRWYRRNTRVAGLLAALLVVLGAGALGVTYLWLTAEKERKRAEAAYDQTLSAIAQTALSISHHPRLKVPEFNSLREEVFAVALKHYVDLMEEMKRNPKDWLRYSQTWAYLSDLRSERNEPAGEAHAAEQAVKTFKSLLDTHPEDPEALSCYGAALHRVAPYREKSERLQLDRQALGFRLAAAERDPTNIRRKSILAESWMYVSKSESENGDQDGARRSAEETIRVYESYLSGKSEREFERPKLADALLWLARKQSGTPEVQVATAQRACAIYEQIVRDHPDSSHHRDLAFAYEELSLHLLRSKDGVRACQLIDKAFEESRASFDHFVRNHATAVALRCGIIQRAYNGGLGHSKLTNMGGLLDSSAAALMGDRPVPFAGAIGDVLHALIAKQYFEQVVEHAGLLPPGEYYVGQQTRVSYLLVTSLYNIGDIHRALGQHAKVLPFWRQAYAKLPEVAKHSAYRQDSIYIARFFAEELIAQHQPDEAMDVLRKAVELGYKDVKHLQNSKEFEPLRSRADFQELVKEVEGKAK